jgi:hypothetical protein
MDTLSTDGLLIFNNAYLHRQGKLGAATLKGHFRLQVQWVSHCEI